MNEINYLVLFCLVGIMFINITLVKLFYELKYINHVIKTIEEEEKEKC